MVDELIDWLGKARYLITLGFTKIYWQVPLTKQAREKTTFVTPVMLFQYTVPKAYDVVVHSTDWSLHLSKIQY